MDLLDKIENTKKYIKYLILIIPLVAIILLFKGCNGTNYKGIEKTLEKEALSFVKENNINITGEKYIEISLLEEVEGTELCSKASGVLVKNVNGKLEASAYLSCPDYESEIIDNKNKYIELNDGDVIVLNVGEIFKDPLYTLKKAAEVRVQGSVGTNPGIYTLYYQAYVSGNLKETVTRKVIRSSADKTTNISGIEDTSRPTITLMGDKNIVLNIGSNYDEPGYLAVDYKDGKITRQVEVSGSVDTNREGKYTITYTVENSRGMSTLESRIITVVRFKADLDITLTVEDKELTNKTNIIVNVKGDGYRYTKLPNGNVISDTNYKFEITKNGTYSVEVYDRYDNKFVKEIEITNIDDEAPTGSCVVNRTANSSIFQVTANDNKGIAGYSYIFETTETDFQTLSEYSVQNKIETGKVKVKDISGNVSELTCEMKEVWDGNCFTSITIPKSYGHRLRGHQDECKNYVKTTGKMSNLCTVTIESSSGIVKGGTNTKGACFTPTDYGNGEITVTYSASCMCDGKPVTGTTNFRISEWGLRSISVSPGSLSPSFYNATYNYTVHVSAGTTSISVGASANHERSKVSGTGTYTLSGKTTRITVSSTTPEGVTTPYYITVIKDD